MLAAICLTSACRKPSVPSDARAAYEASLRLYDASLRLPDGRERPIRAAAVLKQLPASFVLEGGRAFNDTDLEGLAAAKTAGK